MSKLDRELDELLKSAKPRVAKQFRESIKDIVDQAVLGRIIAALRIGDVEAAISALGINNAAFSGIFTEVSATYNAAGTLTTNATVWRDPNLVRVIHRWDMANPVAQEWLAKLSSQRITQITEVTKTAVRNSIQAGYSKGQGPRQIALDVVGRIGANGKRSGGIVGLNAPQEGYVRNMREYLGSSDPKQQAKAFGMSKRDRRFDAQIRKSIDSGKPLTKAQIEKMTGRYSDRLLKLRGDTIARTETGAAVESGRMDAFKQGVDATGHNEDSVIREWDHSGISHLARDSHTNEDGQIVRGLTDPFIMSDGVEKMHPIDGNGGAKHDANCRCRQKIRLDYKRLSRGG